MRLIERLAAGSLALAAISGCQADPSGPGRVTRLVDRIVFRNVDPTGAADLFHVDVSGGEPVRLTSGALGMACPSVSPDGSTIVFSGSGVMTVAADGSDLRDLTPPDTDPMASFSCASWSPDGTRFTVTRRLHRIKSSGTSHLFVIDADGTSANRIASGDTFYQVRWSPSGDKILFSSSSYTDGGPYGFAFNVLNPDGSGLQQTAQTWSGADWSPDASRIAFICGENSNNRLCVSQPNGQTLTILTPPGMLARQPDWAPVGNTIAFACTQGICSINADGTGFRVVAPASGDFAWSPDANLIVYTCASALCAVNPDGTASRTLVDLPGNNGAPAFSPTQ